MREVYFRFKQFGCHHGQSSMKIGIDAVLLGAWANVEGSTILDVGTGCGVIALMCAQRNAEAQILGIDIDENSVKEAAINFIDSPWAKRLEAKLEDFNNIDLNCIDLIISNPPYFESGLKELTTSRLRARHKNILSPEIIIKKGSLLLSDCGRIALIVPLVQLENLLTIAYNNKLFPVRICKVKGRKELEPKRVLLELSKITHLKLTEDILILEQTPGIRSHEYNELCKNFYLDKI